MRQRSEIPLKTIVSEELQKRQIFRALQSFNHSIDLKLSPDIPKRPLRQRWGAWLKSFSVENFWPRELTVNIYIFIYMGFLGDSAVKKPPANQGRRLRFNPWVGKIPWRRKWQPAPVFSPKSPMNRGAWWATGHGVTKSGKWPSLNTSIHTYISILQIY